MAESSGIPQTGMPATELRGAEKESKDPLTNLHDAVKAISRRLDAMMAKRDDAARADDDDDKRKDAARSDEGDDDERDDAARSDDDERKDSRKDAARADKSRDDECEDEDEKERKDAARSDKKRDDSSRKDAGRSDRRRDDAARADDDDDRKDSRKDAARADKKRSDKDLEQWAEEETDEPNHKTDKRKDAARADWDDDDKRDSARADKRRDDAARADEDDDDDEKERKDAARADRRRDDAARADGAALSAALNDRLARLERDRMRSDEDLDRLAELQTEWGKISLAHGDRVSMQPMVGEGPNSYDRRFARRYQKHSTKWGGVDLREVPLAVLRIATPEIRKDAMSAAYQAEPSAEPMLREIKRRDRTGREISEFVGPVSAVNGMLTPFRLPRMRARIIPPSQQGHF